MNSFFTLGAEHQVGEDNQLMKLSKLINWEQFRKEFKGLYKQEENHKGGQQPYDPLKMFKAILLGQWHSLSDPKLEESLRVRLDFMLFTGFELGEELPDETTLCRFRNRLIKRGLAKELFKKINEQLEEYGLKVESSKGAVIDATIIESAARPKRMIEIAEDRSEGEARGGELKNQGEGEIQTRESVDPDAKWLKKGTRYYFGYKGFARVSEGSGFISQVEVTPANQAECKELDHLTLDLTNQVIYADKAYASRENREILKSRKLKDRVLHKATRNHPLTHWQKIFNKAVSKRRYIVEQCFGTLKRQFGCRRSQYMTKEKVAGELYFKSICYNLLKAINQINIVSTPPGLLMARG